VEGKKSDLGNGNEAVFLAQTQMVEAASGLILCLATLDRCTADNCLEVLDH